MELLLWRWSTAAQIVSALILAIFFLVLHRSVRRVELRPWVHAWLVNLAAMVVVIVFWYLQPWSPAAFFLVRVAYMSTKTLFLVLLMVGASGFGRVRIVQWKPAVLAWVGVYTLVGAILSRSLDLLGVTQATAMVVLLGWSAYVLLARSAAPAAGWLAAGFLVRAALAATEAFAHATQAFPRWLPAYPGTGFFLASYSSFDVAAEWVIALGCVLMLYSTIQDELKRTNEDLLAAQDELRQLADRDPMTGLANRRALPAVFREIYDSGATLLFFDLNDFKKINDSYGHHAGDECLRRFSAALLASFRPADRIVRYAGDEFLVIAPAATPAQLEERIATLARQLARAAEGEPPIRFSVGTAELAPHGDPEAALHAADQAMYHDKAGRKTQSAAQR